MSSSPVKASLFSDPVLVRSLQQHAAERDELFRRLRESLSADPRIRTAWLWGSFMRGEADDLSDLDVWMLVEDDHVMEMATALSFICESAGTVVYCAENAYNAPPGGGYLGVLVAGTHGLHHLDIYWQGVSSGALPDAPLFIDRRAETVAVGGLPTPSALPEPIGAEHLRRLAFIWLMLSVAAKYLARDPDSDMSLIQYPKPSFEELSLEMGAHSDSDELNWTAPNEPLGKLHMLRQIARATAPIERVCRERGYEVSERALPALESYFDLVERILRDR